MRRSVAYIRRSSQSKSDPGDVSRDFQTATVRRLAGVGANLDILDGDWGKSAAADKTDRRLVFLELLASIERGEIDTLYAYSTDRLARSVRWAAQLLDACEVAGTTIRTLEATFAPGDDMARTLFHFQAMQNEGYSRQSRTKRRSSIEQMRADGKKLGQPYYGKLPGEDLSAVRAAYETAGSLRGAARLLNAQGVPSRRGHWAFSSVQRIMAREGVVPAVGVRGARHRQRHTFARLLRCHCGHLLTGSRRSDGTTVYRCLLGDFDQDHPRKSVAEGVIQRWAIDEMARLRPPNDDDVAMVEVEEERRSLTVRLDLVKRAFLAGLMPESEMLERKAEIDAGLMRLDLAGQLVQVPPFEWDDDPQTTNLDLRELWEYVQLDLELRPVSAAWLVPDAWLAPPASESPAAPED